MPEQDEDLVTSAEMAEKLGVSERAIRNLAEKQLLDRESPSGYRLRPSVLGYVSHIDARQAAVATTGWNNVSLVNSDLLANDAGASNT